MILDSKQLRVDSGQSPYAISITSMWVVCVCSLFLWCGVIGSYIPHTGLTPYMEEGYFKLKVLLPPPRC